MKKQIIFKLFTVLFICFSGTVKSQPPRGPFVISPQINADKSITFRYLSPQAKEVKMGGSQFLKSPLIMTKDAQGIWSGTTETVKPDIYPYSFTVDGVVVMDPANVAFFPNERFKASLVDASVSEPTFYALKNVPHGIITYEYYPSLESTTGTVVVYTPPGYTKATKTKYPVLYLISGTTDTEETFYKVGKTNLIMDNMIDEGKAKPMIIVMPYGNIAARIAEQKTMDSKPADPVRESADASNRAKAFEDDLIKNIIPFIDKNYRTLNSRENRAIAGFSRGGGQTLRAAFGNMDKFAYVCSYASYINPPEMEKSYGYIGANPEKTNQELKLLWSGIGTEDFLYKGTTEWENYLKEKKVNFVNYTTDGGHTWMNVKKYQFQTLPLLFK